MSSQDLIPQTLTTMEAAFTLHKDEAVQAEFWRHQQRMGPIAAASAGFVCVIGGPIQRSDWLYFSGKWSTPALMDKWQSDVKHTPMQDAAHSRWFASVYLRKWRLPERGEKITALFRFVLGFTGAEGLGQRSPEPIQARVEHFD